MGTTNTTTGSNQSNLQFNPLAQSTYNNLVGGAGSVLGGYINSPFGNSAYRLGASQSQQGAQQAGANNMAALQQNMLTSGIGGQAGAGFKQAQLAQTGRANQAMSSQANVQNVMQALSRQMSAAGTGLSFSPQLTGQSGNFNQQSSMQGLGTWLPQLLSGGLGAGLGLANLGSNSNLFASPMANPTGQGGSYGGGSAPSAPFGPLGPPGGMAGMGSNGLAGMLMQSSPQMPASYLQNVP
jgi:hypothetical protein